MIAVMLYLESEDAKSAASMYFNVPGGTVKAGLAMHDTMRMMPYPVHTVNMGIAADVGAFLVASGTPGKRLALPNSRFLLAQPQLLPPRDNEGKVNSVEHTRHPFSLFPHPPPHPNEGRVYVDHTPPLKPSPAPRRPPPQQTSPYPRQTPLTHSLSPPTPPP